MPVQCFPATVFDDDYFNWASASFKHAPLTGGITAKVFRLTDKRQILKNDQFNVKSVIVKTLKMGEPESVIFGERFIREMMGEFVIPKDRIIPAGTGEFNYLTKRIGLDEKESATLGGLLLMEDLSALGAVSIHSKLKQASSVTEIDEFFAWVRDPAVAKMVGRLMVYDAVIGNEDRISAHRANYGNLMIMKDVDRPVRMFVIDTADKLGRISADILGEVSAQGGLYEGARHENLLRAFVDSKETRDNLISAWFAEMPRIDPQKGAGRSYKKGGYPLNAYVEDEAKEALQSSSIHIEKGIIQATADLIEMITTKNDPRRLALKKTAKGTHSFQMLKANTFYLQARTVRVNRKVGEFEHKVASEWVEAYGRKQVAKTHFNPPTHNAADPSKYTMLKVPDEMKNKGNPDFENEL